MSNDPVDLKRYHSENANRYADLMAMIQNLKDAYLHFHAGEISVAEIHEDNHLDRGLQTHAHWLAGAMLYNRVFDSPERSFRRSNFVENLRPDLQDFHNWLLRVLDNDQEPMPTISRCNGDTGVGYISLRVFNPRQSVLHQCLRFVREIIRLLELEAGIAYARFQAEAAVLDDQFLKSLPAAPSQSGVN